jgi:regulation of enolase protein 1 (concanavalin A-like superfamily)
LTPEVGLVGRLTGVQNTNTYAKAGLMIRASNAPDAPHVILDVRPSGDLEFMTRASAGDVTTFLGTAFQPTPTWLRLTRSGTTVTADVSADGGAWATIGWTTLAIDSNALAGLVVAGVAASTINTSTFDNVSLTPVAVPP